MKAIQPRLDFDRNEHKIVKMHTPHKRATSGSGLITTINQ